MELPKTSCPHCGTVFEPTQANWQTRELVEFIKAMEARSADHSILLATLAAAKTFIQKQHLE